MFTCITITPNTLQICANRKKEQLVQIITAINGMMRQTMPQLAQMQQAVSFSVIHLVHQTLIDKTAPQLMEKDVPEDQRAEVLDLKFEEGPYPGLPGTPSHFFSQHTCGAGGLRVFVLLFAAGIQWPQKELCDHDLTEVTETQTCIDHYSTSIAVLKQAASMAYQRSNVTEADVIQSHTVYQNDPQVCACLSIHLRLRSHGGG